MDCPLHFSSAGRSRTQKITEPDPEKQCGEVAGSRVKRGDFELHTQPCAVLLSPVEERKKLLSGDNRMNQRFRAGQTHTAWRLIPVLCLFVVVFLL